MVERPLLVVATPEDARSVEHCLIVLPRANGEGLAPKKRTTDMREAERWSARETPSGGAAGRAGARRRHQVG